ncbi:MAG: hypothetical protein HFE77_03130 [Clostridiales bacterium]|nr:hypothetical protein [Clostridiales bacterium]
MISDRYIRYYLFSILFVLAGSTFLYYAHGIFGGTLLSIFSLTASTAFDYLKILFWPLGVWIIADRLFFRHLFFENHMIFFVPFLLLLFTILSLCAFLPDKWQTAASLLTDVGGVFLFFSFSFFYKTKVQIVSTFAHVISFILCLTLMTLFAAFSLFTTDAETKDTISQNNFSLSNEL